MMRARKISKVLPRLSEQGKFESRSFASGGFPAFVNSQPLKNELWTNPHSPKPPLQARWVSRANSCIGTKNKECRSSQSNLQRHGATQTFSRELPNPGHLPPQPKYVTHTKCKKLAHCCCVKTCEPRLMRWCLLFAKRCEQCREDIDCRFVCRHR